MPKRALEILFENEGGVRLSGGVVVGARAVVQSALVNLLTEADDDMVYPDRGTTILEAALSGRASSDRGAQHEANFAASDLLFFSREHDRNDPLDQLDTVVLNANLVGGGILDLEASFVTQSGENLSYPLRSQ